MKESTYYFSHDNNAQNDPKILCLRSVHGWAGYGLYWALIELMHIEPLTCLKHGLISGASMVLHTPESELKTLIAYCIEIGLFVSNGEEFWSESLRRRKAEYRSIKQKLSDAGKKGAQARLKPPLSDPEAPLKQLNESKGKKSKGKKKEIQYSPEFEEFWSIYPKPLGRGKGDKERTFKMFKAIPDNRRNDFMTATENYKIETAKKNNEFVKNAQNFLAVWEDYIEGYVDPKDVIGSPEWMREKGHNHPDVVMWKTKNGIKAF